MKKITFLVAAVLASAGMSAQTIQEMQKAGCSRFGMGMRSVQNLIKSIYK